MLKEKELREFRPTYRYADGQAITLLSIQEAIKDAADKKGILVAFEKDQVKGGTLLKSTVDDCLVLFHPEHRNEFFKFCIRVRKQGTYAFISVNDFGESKHLGAAMGLEANKEAMQGHELSERIGASIGRGIRGLFVDKEKVAIEQMWLQCVQDIFDEVIC